MFFSFNIYINILIIIDYLITFFFTDIPEDRLDSLLKSINKDTPLINNNINECSSVDINNKTDGIIYFYFL